MDHLGECKELGKGKVLLFCLYADFFLIQIKITPAIDPSSGLDINFSSLLTLQRDQ